MKRIRITITLGLLSALCISGCICPPSHQFGMQRSFISNPAIYEAGCDPCGPVDACGVIEYGGNFASSRYRVADCRDSLANLSNGAFLVKRGILDIAASPFVLIGSALTSNCRYEVLSFCEDVRYTRSFVDPCSQAFDSCSSGCDTCANGYSEGIRYGARNQHHHASVVLPPAPRLSNSIIQASYETPTAPAARFVQPPR
ncbi:MAG: hypothetical protein FWG73_00420 [Planctomycetaceae bacterium]|nr:hypothetical protein [Planctomycetaceae bacterium]